MFKMQSKFIQKVEDEQIAQIVENRKSLSVPQFRAGDTLKIHMKISEKDKERIQMFEGFCIAKRNRGFNSSFTLRKISHGNAVEMIFSLYSPNISEIEVTRYGKVRRAKIYYIRNIKGKVRIPEKNTYSKSKQSTKTQ